MMERNSGSKAECVITGVSGRFPSADTMAEFEYKLFNKIDMVTEDESRWKRGILNLPARNGKIRSIDKFDADYFDIPANTAEFIDPQDRIFLELVVEAAADAGESSVLREILTLTFVNSLCRSPTGTHFWTKNRTLLGLMFPGGAPRLRGSVPSAKH